MQQNQEQNDNEEVQQEEEFIQIIHQVIFECAGFDELKKYICINKPSFNLVRDCFEKVLEKDNGQKFEENLQKVFEELIKNNVPRLFMRIIFQHLQNNKEKINLIKYKESGIVQNWKNLQIQDINEFIKIFQLEDQINEDELLKHFQDLINKKKFDDAFQFYKALNLPQKYIHNLLDQMGNNNDASKAADFIKKLDQDPKDFPKIVERLEKSCIRYMSQEYPWFKCEEMLQYQKQLLIYYCEDAYYRGNKREALSIVKRNNLLNEIQKQQQKEQMQKDFQEGFEEMPNVLVLKDEFKATEEFINDEIGVYLSCQDFGYSENNIILIDKVDENYINTWKIIHSSQAVGYDCEHVTPWTKLDINGFKVCLIQIATEKHTFLFDFQKLKEKQEFKHDLKQLLENVQILKIGLNLKDDLKNSVKHLSLKNIIIRSIIELSSAFKILEKDPKMRSLAFISEFYFKKKLSKFETCSNWEKRPLRKAQIHYAALDAIVSLQLYLKMREQNNQVLEQEKDMMSIN